MWFSTRTLVIHTAFISLGGAWLVTSSSHPNSMIVLGIAILCGVGFAVSVWFDRKKLKEEKARSEMWNRTIREESEMFQRLWAQKVKR